MGFFRASAQLGRCEQCRTLFDPVYGGACARCGRLLCAAHLHGGFWRQLVARLVPRRSTICAACRASRAWTQRARRCRRRCDVDFRAAKPHAERNVYLPPS